MENVRKKRLVIVGIMLLSMSLVVFLAGVKIVKAKGKDVDGDGLPNSVEKVYNTNPYTADTDGDGQNDKVDDKPLFAKNPIKETSDRKLPVKIKDVRVEDNYTSSGDAPDHLQITMKNTGKNELKDFQIYYTIIDNKTGKKEAYYRNLKLNLSSGEKVTIHFDNKNKINHYPGNMNGLYGNSVNGLTFQIMLHVKGFQPLNFKVKKDPGKAEIAD